MILLITGPESSGKTSLSEQIANKTNFVCLPEYARIYLQKKKTPDYNFLDLEKIAVEHIRRFKQLQKDEPCIILDTFLLNLKIWSNYKFEKTSELILDALDEFKPDLTFLLKPDIPWEADPLREHPNDRDKLFDLFESEIKLRKDIYQVLSGQNRETKALRQLGF